MGSAAGLPDGNMEVSIKPGSGSVLLADTNQEIFVTVIDGAPVVDAVVIGILDDGTELYFNNDGDFPDVKDKDNVYSYYLPLPEQPRKMRLTLVVTAPDKKTTCASSSTTSYRYRRMIISPMPPSSRQAVGWWRRSTRSLPWRPESPSMV